MFTNLAHEEGVFLLLVAPNQWVLQVFHQADLVGGVFSITAKLMVVLSGFDSRAVPVEIEVDTSVVDVEEEAWSWDLLADANICTTEHFMTLTSSEPFQFWNLIGIPNFLAQAYLDSATLDPVHLFAIFCMAMLDFDEEHEHDREQKNVFVEGVHILPAG